MDGDWNLIGLNIKVDIHRRAAAAASGWGDTSDMTWVAIPTYRDVRARISTLRVEEREALASAGGNIATIAAHRIFFNPETDVLIGDHIVYDGKTYEMVSIEDMDKSEQHLEGFIVFWKGVVA